jgi:hypothetical protein
MLLEKWRAGPFIGAGATTRVMDARGSGGAESVFYPGFPFSQ